MLGYALIITDKSVSADDIKSERAMLGHAGVEQEFSLLWTFFEEVLEPKVATKFGGYCPGDVEGDDEGEDDARISGKCQDSFGSVEPYANV